MPAPNSITATPEMFLDCLLLQQGRKGVVNPVKRRKRIAVSLTVALLVFAGLSWKAYRVRQQANLNYRLITAIKQAEFKHGQSIEVLAWLKRGADPNARDEPYGVALTWNRLLILIGVKQDKAPRAQTALFLALEGEMNDFVGCVVHDVDTDIVKTLLRYGADVRGKDRYGRTPLVAAFSPIPRALCAQQGDVNKQTNGKCELALIAAGSDVEAHDEFGFTALMKGFDCENGKEVVEALLRKGADVNAHPEGTTALLYRARSRDKAGCLFFLEHGADVDAAEDGHTALTYAAESGDDAMVDLLLKHRANVNANVGRGKTALMAAASEGHSAVMRILLQHGAAASPIIIVHPEIR